MALNFSIAEFAELVKKAHGSRNGLDSIEAELVDPSILGSTIVVKATVRMTSGQTFTAMSSAKDSAHGYTPIEIAERRAKIIALIEATNSADMLEQAEFKPDLSVIGTSEQFDGQ